MDHKFLLIEDRANKEKRGETKTVGRKRDKLGRYAKEDIKLPELKAVFQKETYGTFDIKEKNQVLVDSLKILKSLGQVYIVLSMILGVIESIRLAFFIINFIK
ncbi:hypothetical protein P9E34_19540 [Schinkia azotoformans]|uniref:hypothetical protein n=1 Tax=Schinkia azotoformans TaxID=1454 RepID=UPI002DBDDE0F|nr:hypothetical protein [Schinkia azotoformans]MEC1726907.1 hypothetical protein [Schinkia azotoformans]